VPGAAVQVTPRQPTNTAKKRESQRDAGRSACALDCLVLRQSLVDQHDAGLPVGHVDKGELRACSDGLFRPVAGPGGQRLLRAG